MQCQLKIAQFEIYFFEYLLCVKPFTVSEYKLWDHCLGAVDWSGA